MPKGAPSTFNMAAHWEGVRGLVPRKTAATADEAPDAASEAPRKRDSCQKTVPDLMLCETAATPDEAADAASKTPLKQDSCQKTIADLMPHKKAATADEAADATTEPPLKRARTGSAATKGAHLLLCYSLPDSSSC